MAGRVVAVARGSVATVTGVIRTVTETVETPNGPHQVRVAGHGPPMMVVPGGPGFGAEYMIGPLVEQLGHVRTMLFVDQRGSGGSPVGRGPLTMAAYVDDMAAIVDHFGHDRVDVLGHSFGGLQALWFAMTVSSRVGRVVIADGDGPTHAIWAGAFAPGAPLDRRSRPEDAERVRAISATDGWTGNQQLVDEYLVARFGAMYTDRRVAEGIIHGMDGPAVKQLDVTTAALRADLGDWDITDRLATITAPVLLVYCRDSIQDAATSTELLAGLPFAALVWVDGGHAPFIEDPEGFQVAVVPFLMGSDHASAS